MRITPILILLMLTLLPVDGIRHEMYSKANFSDEGIYLYFSDLIKDAEECLDGFLNEDPNALNSSIDLHRKVKTIEDECRFYMARGVKSNVSIVVHPFVSLSKGILNLIRYQSVFLKNVYELHKKNYTALNARTALICMKSSVNEINDSINDIENVVLWNETSKLYFDVSDLKRKLKDVLDLIAYYESLLEGFEIEGILVVVSDKNPYLYQEITIQVYARNVTPTTLFIDKIGYEIKSYTIKKSFEEVGEHEIYAEGVKDGKIVKSNVVKIYISKIPTYISLTSRSVAFINEKVDIKGFLYDYYGKPLCANVKVRIDGEENELRTYNGSFKFNVTKSYEGFLDVSVSYAGNETHRGSNASLSIYFSRFLISISIDADRTQVNVNETVNFVGKIYGDVHTPIYIIVNSKVVKELNVTDCFNFTLNFSKPGRYVVFAYFPGDPLHKPAKSNKIGIIVKSGVKNYLYYLLSVAFVVSVILLLAYAKRKKKDEERIELKEEILKKEVKEETKELKRLDIPNDVREAYRMLFEELSIRYNLKRSLTPRELLKALRNEHFAEKLRIVTELHERNVYGGVELKEEEKRIYFECIRYILSAVMRI